MSRQEVAESSILVRPEEARDHEAIARLNRKAFGSDAEADLVAELRRAADPFLSLVAEKQEQLVGHIVFTPVRVEEAPDCGLLLGLGPMAVQPEEQREGIGSRLVEEGLAACRAAGARAVFVLGHRLYYPRFGFRFAVVGGFRYPAPGTAAHFMLLELEPGALSKAGGTVRYHPAFEHAGA